MALFCCQATSDNSQLIVVIRIHWPWPPPLLLLLLLCFPRPHFFSKDSPSDAILSISCLKRPCRRTIICSLITTVHRHLRIVANTTSISHTLSL